MKGEVMAAKLRLKIESCKVATDDGVRLLEKCGFPTQRAKEIIRSLPMSVTYRSTSERSGAYKLLQFGFNVKLT